MAVRKEREIILSGLSLDFLLQVVFVELTGLIDQEWSHAAGQMCKIIVSDEKFSYILLQLYLSMLN